MAVDAQDRPALMMTDPLLGVLSTRNSVALRTLRKDPVNGEGRMNESGQWSAMSANNPPFGFVRARVRGAMGAGRGKGAGRAARGCDGRPARAFARRRQNSPGGGHRHGPVRAGFPAGTPKGDDDGKARKTPPLRAWERPGEWTPRGGGGVGRRAAPRTAGRWRIRAAFRPNPPNADGRAEKTLSLSSRAGLDARRPCPGIRGIRAPRRLRTPRRGPGGRNLPPFRWRYNFPRQRKPNDDDTRSVPIPPQPAARSGANGRGRGGKLAAAGKTHFRAARRAGPRRSLTWREN